jgi:hypothetical protein
MAAFSTFAEVLTPAENPLNRGQGRVLPPGFVLADVLRQAGGAYQAAVPMSGRFRACIRAVAELTSDEDLLRIAELPEVPVSLENCRRLDPQTRIVMVCRLDVSAAETPRWRRIPLAGVPAWPRGEPRILDMCRGACIEERVLAGGRSLLRMRPAADLPALHPVAVHCRRPPSSCQAAVPPDAPPRESRDPSSCCGCAGGQGSFPAAGASPSLRVPQRSLPAAPRAGSRPPIIAGPQVTARSHFR